MRERVLADADLYRPDSSTQRQFDRNISCRYVARTAARSEQVVDLEDHVGAAPAHGQSRPVTPARSRAAPISMAARQRARRSGSARGIACAAKPAPPRAGERARGLSGVARGAFLQIQGCASALGEPGPAGHQLMSRETATPAAMTGSRLYGGPMASVKQIQVTFDCAEPERVARFWCQVLGYVVPPPPEGFATWDDFDRALPPEREGSAFACIDPSGVGPRLFFQRVPEGKVVKNRLHLDVRVGTGLVGEERVAALEAECARLVALGAVRVRLLPADGYDESCLVIQDIEGNEFCLD